MSSHAIVNVGDVFTNRMGEKVEVIEYDHSCSDIKVVYDGREFVVPKSMLQGDISNGTLVYAYTMAGGQAITPRVSLSTGHYELDKTTANINPHIGCRHEWKRDTFFSAKIYETCTKCGCRKEDV